MTRSAIGSAALALVVAGAFVAACADVNNDNQGVDMALMNGGGDAGSCTAMNAMGMMVPVPCDGGMDSGMPDGGDAGECMMVAGMMVCPDGGNMDAGDGGCMLPDGGMDMACMGTDGGDSGMPMVRRVWFTETQSGSEGMDGIDPRTNNAMPMTFVMMNGFGGISGTPSGLVLSMDQMFGFVAFSRPSKVAVIDMAARDEGPEIALGGANDDSADIVWSVVPNAIVAGKTQNKLYVVSTSAKNIAQTVDATALTGLSQPTSLNLNASGSTVVIGSASATQNKILFADVTSTGTLTPRNDRAITLVESTTTGLTPTRCSFQHTRDEGFCLVSGGADTSGPAGQSVWEFTLGGNARRVLTLPNPAADVITSPDDQRLFVTTNGVLSVYWIGGDARFAPMHIQDVAIGAGANRIAIDHDAANLFVTNNIGGGNGTVVKLRLADHTVLTTFPGYGNPDALYVAP